MTSRAAIIIPTKAAAGRVWGVADILRSGDPAQRGRRIRVPAGFAKRLLAFTVLAIIFTLAPLALFFAAFTALPGWGA